MSLRRIIATAGRFLRQLRHDPRTIGLVVIVPCVLLIILRYVFDGEQPAFRALAPMILGIFPLLMMFLVTSIATLRERTSGTLDRLMTEPVAKLDLVLGYALGFAVVAIVQALVAAWVTIGWLGVTIEGSWWQVVVAAILSGFLGTSLGLLVSAFATTEFQAVQLVMPIMMPQVLVCGLFVPRDHMARLLRWCSDIFPVTYSVDAMKEISAHTTWTGRLSRDLIVVIVFGFAALILGSITIRRQEA